MTSTTTISDYRQSICHDRQTDEKKVGEALIENAIDQELPISPLLKVFLMKYNEEVQDITEFVEQMSIDNVLKYTHRVACTSQELSVALSDLHKELTDTLSRELEKLLSDLYKNQFYRYFLQLQSRKGWRCGKYIGIYLASRLDYKLLINLHKKGESLLKYGGPYLQTIPDHSLPFNEPVKREKMVKRLYNQLGSKKIPGISNISKLLLEKISSSDVTITLDMKFEFLDDTDAVMLHIESQGLQEEGSLGCSELVSSKVGIDELARWLSTHLNDTAPSQVCYRETIPDLSGEITIYDIELSGTLRDQFYELSDGREMRAALTLLKSTDSDSQRAGLRENIDDHPGVVSILEKESCQRSVKKLENLIDHHNNQLYIWSKYNGDLFNITDSKVLKVINKLFNCKRSTQKITKLSKETLEACFLFHMDDKGQIICYFYDDYGDRKNYKSVLSTSQMLDFIRQLVDQKIPLSQCLVAAKE